MTRNNPDFQTGKGEFYVAGMGLGRKYHLWTGDTSTKCTKLGDVHEKEGPIVHPGGDLTLEKVGDTIQKQAKENYRLVGISHYDLCPKCFPRGK